MFSTNYFLENKLDFYQQSRPHKLPRIARMARNSIFETNGYYKIWKFNFNCISSEIILSGFSLVLNGTYLHNSHGELILLKNIKYWYKKKYFSYCLWIVETKCSWNKNINEGNGPCNRYSYRNTKVLKVYNR